MAATSPGQGMHPAAYFGPFSSCTQRWTVSFGLYTGKRKWLIRLPACGCHLIERCADRPKRTGSTASQEKGGDLSKEICLKNPTSPPRRGSPRASTLAISVSETRWLRSWRASSAGGCHNVGGG